MPEAFYRLILQLVLYQLMLRWAGNRGTYPAGEVLNMERVGGHVDNDIMETCRVGNRIVLVGRHAYGNRRRQKPGGYLKLAG